ncbi:ATP-binding protein [candidate division KSB1 bacterium]|nr:ATP-binding protein [candidate division KSB1 bacterium]NIR69577.1 ATP-binding protein [candidate division KSB1 bacterium]NIS25925.1 ATP-binding protein [candidate division KSB1 bacterium]NIT72806.1 ATP-binding protein [candidate division KSB1 bacterium]NIU26613.1 ATP-binding protein [candidate division KSB1 bacterium]
MLITRAHLKAFRSVFEFGFPIDPKITVMIGANESGKTNILRGLESFRPDFPFTNSLTCQYSDYYYQGRCPEVTLEFSHLSRENRRNLIPFSEIFKDVEKFSVIKNGPDLTNYHVFVKDEELSISNIKRFLEFLPKILYFDNISLIKSRVELDTLLNGDVTSRTERNLLKIGGLQNNFEIIFEDSTRGRRASEEAGKLITQQIRRVWSQEPTIEIKLNVNGKVLYIDISDGTTVYDTAESRSLGFRWYLSFYINFIAQTFEAKANEYFFLIDEPGIHLHPAGQKDLTKVMEDLAIKNQLIYTTHSPFMINREFPQRVRLVYKGREGTKIDNCAYRDNWKPLRRSIGLVLGDLFFFNDSSFILEVPSKKTSIRKKLQLFKSHSGKNA